MKVSPTKHSFSQKLNVLSYKNLDWLFLPFCHNSRVWQTDRRTDGLTDRQTDFSSLDRVYIPCSVVKTLTTNSLMKMRFMCIWSIGIRPRGLTLCLSCLRLKFGLSSFVQSSSNFWPIQIAELDIGILNLLTYECVLRIRARSFRRQCRLGRSNFLTSSSPETT